MLALERDLLSASKKDETYRSEEMKVEMFRMSMVERFCEYMDSYHEFFKRGSLLLSNYHEEVTRTKSASRKQVEDILNTTLEVDAEEAAEVAALLPPPAIFASALEDTVRRDLTPVPRIMLHIVAFLDQFGLAQMGIFRISGHSGSVQALKEAIDSGHEVDLTLLNNVHVAATLFKLYLRTLPDTLTTYAKFDDWLKTLEGEDPGVPKSPSSGLASPNSYITIFTDDLIEKLASLVDSLPFINQCSLDYLIAFCTRVVAHSEQNMMGAKNLASLIAPNIMSRAESATGAGTMTAHSMLEEVSLANRIVECMILNYARIFKGVHYDYKDRPINSLAALAAEFPLCADRTVKHGQSLIVDLPPEEVSILESLSGSSPKSTSEDLRKRHQAKKKTVSSLSLIKERKIKKKDRDSAAREGSRGTIVVGESDFKVPPNNSGSLRPLSPRNREHVRTASEKPTMIDGSPMGTGKSPPSAFSSPGLEWGSRSLNHDELMSSNSYSGEGGIGTSQTSPEIPPLNLLSTSSSSQNLKSSTDGAPTTTLASSSSSSNLAAPSKSTSTPVQKRPKKLSRARGPSAGAAAAPKPKESRVSRHVEVVTRESESPAPRARRHSIGEAEGEGLDPTKENFSAIAPSAVSASSSSSTLNVAALVDDQSGSLRGRAGSRRGSVLQSPYGPGSRSNSISSRDRVLTPTKLRFPSPSDDLIRPSASLPSSTVIPVPTSQTPPPFSPISKDKEKRANKDRTSALTSTKFENPEDFNKLMDERFGKGPIASYVVLGYNDSSGAIRMQAGGEGGVDEMVSQLKDDQIQYCLIRITYLEDGHTLTRDVFVQWNGPKVSAIQKGIKKAHCGEVKTVLCPTAIELLASSKANFTLETLLARSAPTAIHIID
jgi:hypothetical protein